LEKETANVHSLLFYILNIMASACVTAPKKKQKQQQTIARY